MGTLNKPMDLQYRIREAQADDGDAIRALMPRLAAFEIPEWRSPEDLWRHDAQMLSKWMAGDAPDWHVYVAAGPAGAILGVAMFSVGPELLSEAPSAHLEVVAVAQSAEGQGVGKALVNAAQAAARELGAQTMTLHVFSTNERARKMYDRLGYDGELVRYIKLLE